MKRRRLWILGLWLACVACAVGVIGRARYVTDLSAFLPAHPTAEQQLLVDQLREGPASRLILVALEGGEARIRARVAKAMTKELRADGRFSHVDDGEPIDSDRDQRFLFEHRYLLSDAVTAQHFSAAALRAAIDDTTSSLATSAGMLLKSLVPHDPTGETLHLADQLTPRSGPRAQDGVWVSADAARTLLVAQTIAGGSDTDAQAVALAAIRTAFDSARAEGTEAAGVHLRMSGPGVFAVTARDNIKRTATHLSLLSSALVICLLLAVYRSVVALGLGLLPVATGALVGVAAVALGFGAVHGTTLGFGITLIGESVDYSIYFFIAAASSFRLLLWPTIRLGMLTSVFGFASLLPSGFPGLAQLGLYSISGLIAAALVTRFVLPELTPPDFVIRDVAPVGAVLGRWRNAARAGGNRPAVGIACVLGAGALFVLHQQGPSLWNRELSALSPIAPDALSFDATLRRDLGTSDVLDLIVVSGATVEEALRGAERAGEALKPLVEARELGGYDSPATYLPSLYTQRLRRDSLPDADALRSNLREATVGSDLKDDALQPFVADVVAARSAPLVTPEELRGTSLAAGFDALTLHHGARWSALLALHSADGAPINLDRIRAALSAARLPAAVVLDMKAGSDALYGGYVREAIRLSMIGLGLIIVLLACTLREARRVARVLAPLLLAVAVVTAALTLCGRHLTLLHLVGMLLIVAVGSNYALFFDHENDGGAASPLTLSSLLVANLSTVIAFGLLSFSQVPVLEALGTTVAPGAFLSLIFSALLTSRRHA